MSRKQTRRSVSMNEKLYLIVQAHCRTLDVPVAGWLEGLAMRELKVEANLLVESDRAPRSMATFRREVLKRREEASPQTEPTGPDPKVEAAKRAVMRTPVEVQQAAVDNPCRLQGCHREGLHEAHDDRPGLFYSRRS